MTFFIFSVTAMIIFVGAALAFQAPVNSVLARAVGDPVWAAAMQFGIGFMLLCCIAAMRGSSPSIAQFREIPWWALTGGALGAIWILAAIWSVPHLGVVTMFAAMILGQMIAALLIDSGGLLGLEARNVSATRIASVGLVAAGVVLSYR